MQADVRLCRLLQLVSPALPIGSYAYSHGFEYAVQQQWIHDEASALSWIKGYLQDGIAGIDLPILARCYRTWQTNDMAELNHWNTFIGAIRETRELQLEDRQQAQGLLRLYKNLETNSPIDESFENEAQFVSVFSLIAWRWEISLEAALTGYAWSWCENQVSCAIKLIPLGQTAGQRILSNLSASIPEICARALRLNDEDIGASTPSLVIGSALHETQYTRLFRS